MDSTQIELSAKDITVHQTSEEEDTEDNRKTASLGDLSKLDGHSNKNSGTNRPQTGGTLERAQSMEITEPNQQNLSTAITPKKRKAPVSETNLSEKEPRLMSMEMDDMDTLQRGRLRSAYEWGNLEDAISNKDSIEDSRSSDTESSGRMEDAIENGKSNASMTSFEQEVMAVMETEKEELKRAIEQELEKKLDIIDNSAKVIGEVPMKTMEQLLKEKLKEAEAALETDDDEDHDQKRYTEMNYTTTTTLNGNDLSQMKLDNSADEPEIVAEIKMKNGHSNDDHHFNNSVSFISPISFKFKVDDQVVEGRNPVLRLNSNSGSPSINTDMSENATDQVKIINYGTNMPDDVKVSRFPFGSLERPKSDVLKKLIAQKLAPLEDFSSPDMATSVTATTTTILSEPQPISLTLIRGDPIEGELIPDEAISSQVPPVYSSDVKGVNSISISSMEVNIGPSPSSTNTSFGSSNIVTISTNTELSQPSSIILIDDEKLDFTLQTPPSELSDESFHRSSSPTPPIPPLPSMDKLKDEVFIVDTQPKLHNKTEETEEFGEMLSDQDVLDALKTFVTEIQVQNDKNTTPPASPNDCKVDMGKFLEQEKLNSVIRSPSSHSFIPRNTEIKFTTSTYEASSPRITGTLNGTSERRHSSNIEQIRSAFERNASHSEIPVPARKSSIPTLKMSPSKIPVFNSSSNNNNNSNLVNNNNSKSTDQLSNISPPTLRYSTTSSGSNSTVVSPNASTTRLVSVTSIKNSARHPSGK